MERNNKTYGFTIAVKELRETVPNIFRYAAAYKRMNNLTSKGLWEMFVEKPEKKPTKAPQDDPKYKKPLPEEILNSEPGSGSLPEIDLEGMEGEKYNMCHFWSNFEIARLDWFRSKAYNDFFEMMDRSGGFWMERVSDGTATMYMRKRLTRHSGEMRQFTRLLQELSWAPRIFTTSVTLGIGIRRFSIAQRMPRRGSCPTSRTWK
jgi:hypothetical protein